MKDFKFSYDEENDDLFIYLPEHKSAGAVEIGDFVLDFDKDENLVAMQIFNASEVLSKLVSKIVSLTQIKALKTQVINFRNMNVIKLDVTLATGKYSVNITIPRIKERPALQF